MPSRAMRIGIAALTVAGGLSLLGIPGLVTHYESYSSLYDAEYVGAGECAGCHGGIYETWQESPHANMTRVPSPETVVGDFEDHAWHLPESGWEGSATGPVAARMVRKGERYYMALRDPSNQEFVPFPVDYVIGYQYRQTYLTREDDGVLRRLPLQWSVGRQEFFPYWNLQEGSRPTEEDLWAQMGSMNSAWNLFCGRCHTTNLDILDKAADHSWAHTPSGPTTASPARPATGPAAST